MPMFPPIAHGPIIPHRMDAPDETVNVQDEPPKKKIHRGGKRQHRAHKSITPEIDRHQVKQRDPSPSPDGSKGH
eukprot:85898-Amphidinium_carterae.1